MPIFLPARNSHTLTMTTQTITQPHPSPHPTPTPQAVAKGVPEAELERAKAAAVSSVLMNLESRAVVAEDIGRQVLTYGHRCGRVPPAQLAPAHRPRGDCSAALLPFDLGCRAGLLLPAGMPAGHANRSSWPATCPRLGSGHVAKP